MSHLNAIQEFKNVPTICQKCGKPFDFSRPVISNDYPSDLRPLMERFIDAAVKSANCRQCDGASRTNQLPQDQKHNACHTLITDNEDAL